MSRELVKLPCGNQEALLESISKHHLSCRETRKLVDELIARPACEHQAILQRPWAVLQQQNHLDTTESNSYSPLVRNMHRKLLVMERQCLSASFVVQNTEFGQFEEEEERFFLTCCAQAVHTLEQTGRTFRQTVPHDRAADQ